MQKQQAPVTETVFNVQNGQRIYFFKVLRFSGKVFMCTSIYDLLDSLYMYIVYKFERTVTKNVCIFKYAFLLIRFHFLKQFI